MASSAFQAGVDSVPVATLTTNGDLLTRAAGVMARLTRADLAVDLADEAAFAAAYDPRQIHSVPSPNALDDEFATDAVDGAWVDQAPTGTVSWVQKRHGLTVSASVDVASGDLACRLKPGTIAVGECFETMIDAIAPYSIATGMLLVLTDGTATTSVPCAGGLYFSNAGPYTWVVNGGTLTAYSGSVTANNFNLGMGLIKVRIRRSASTTYVVEYSMDGYTWTTFDVAALTSATTHTHVGFAFTNVAGTNAGLARFEYIRKYTA